MVVQCCREVMPIKVTIIIKGELGLCLSEKIDQRVKKYNAAKLSRIPDSVSREDGGEDLRQVPHGLAARDVIEGLFVHFVVLVHLLRRRFGVLGRLVAVVSVEHLPREFDGPELVIQWCRAQL